MKTVEILKNMNKDLESKLKSQEGGNTASLYNNFQELTKSKAWKDPKYSFSNDEFEAYQDFVNLTRKYLTIWDPKGKIELLGEESLVALDVSNLKDLLYNKKVSAKRVMTALTNHLIDKIKEVKAFYITNYNLASAHNNTYISVTASYEAIVNYYVKAGIASSLLKNHLNKMFIEKLDLNMMLSQLYSIVREDILKISKDQNSELDSDAITCRVSLKVEELLPALNAAKKGLKDEKKKSGEEDDDKNMKIEVCPSCGVESRSETNKEQNHYCSGCGYKF
ncbi:Uncharacterised protein [Candidatus Tiddalikarchaeum anstoanum]|nr:Uncharacterised protein [Candidatus Tiddalikarchaeum anstoanum]